jgi:hypothetical protein
LISTATNKKGKLSLYQVLLLDNSKNQDVTVQEAEQVDFCVVKEHLKNGGSVFITSKVNQKISLPKSRAQINYSRSRRTMGFLFHQQLRN